MIILNEDLLTMFCRIVQGVTALACTSDSKRVEHKGAVTCIKIRRNDKEVCACIESDKDYYCINYYQHKLFIS